MFYNIFLNLHNQKTVRKFAPELYNASTNSFANKGGCLFSANNKDSFILLNRQVAAHSVYWYSQKLGSTVFFIFKHILSE